MKSCNLLNAVSQQASVSAFFSSGVMDVAAVLMCDYTGVIFDPGCQKSLVSKLWLSCDAYTVMLTPTPRNLALSGPVVRCDEPIIKLCRQRELRTWSSDVPRPRRARRGSSASSARAQSPRPLALKTSLHLRLSYLR